MQVMVAGFIARANARMNEPRRLSLIIRNAGVDSAKELFADTKGVFIPAMHGICHWRMEP